MNAPGTSGVDELVRAYLIAKGYTKSLEVFDHEINYSANPSDNQAAMSSLLNNVAESLYVTGIQKGDQNIYMQEFEDFATWVTNSLDLVKPYLNTLKFAIFVHW